MKEKNAQLQEYIHINSIAEFSKVKSYYDLPSLEDITGKASEQALFQGGVLWFVFFFFLFFSAE